MNLKNKNLLLIDDCLDTGLLVKQTLKFYQVNQCTTIAGAKNILEKENIDLLLIDVNLPDGSGFDYCLELASDKRYSDVPKILLTGKAEAADRVYGLNCGAVDYITKPFIPPELRARIEIHLRQNGSQVNEAIFRCVDFEFDLEFQICSLVKTTNKQNLNLTPTEFRLFYFLVKNEGHVLSREELEVAIWKSTGAQIEKRGIDSHIAHIRRKLKDQEHLLVSVYGRGYSFKANSNSLDSTGS